MIAAAALALALTASPDPAFVLTGAGRYAVLADVASIARQGDTVRMRAFQAVEPDFSAGGEAYWGGWSWWAFDCSTRMADRLDFASVREGGREGPSTPDRSPAYPAAPGGDAAELLAVACSPPVTIDATTLEDAVRLGRAALAQ
ncbi:hypothetical protein [Brevundimonas variabilis]|uniref:Uncharacterized protein n=1 Tax=Brevundimonas variabilis TaxID=74312 RepID=A0A7W9CF53_9CAUL|nr:hypothetical protein [Brevundimonas variabilis]MBB5744485.1 hypothetical protein [Brevundimonas variabilis]